MTRGRVGCDLLRRSGTLVGRRCLYAVVALLAACTAPAQQRPPAPAPAAPIAFANDWTDNWEIDPATASERLRTGPAAGLEKSGAGGGTTGVRKITLEFRDSGDRVSVKWKGVPARLDGWNNSPRKELAAYQVQKLFLDPEDYVVPATVARCPPVRDPDRTIDMSERGMLGGTNCALGVAALWLNNVHAPRRLWDEERFNLDAPYRLRIANFDLLTYLMDHRDGRRGNFLMSKNPARPVVYAIDNGIGFDSWIYNYFVPNWNDLRVDALPKQAIDRLRAVTRADLDRLGVVAELRLDEHGIFQPVEPGPNLAPKQGARRRGDVVQFGLKTREIDEIEEKIADLLEDVDDGDYLLF